jgi:hypothetical protein
MTLKVSISFIVTLYMRTSRLASFSPNCNTVYAHKLLQALHIKLASILQI